MDIKNLKLATIWQSTLRIMPVLIAAIFIISFTVLTYVSVLPRDDDTVKSEGALRVESLKINFNQKLLRELTAEKVSAGPVSGRNPFIK
jgi:hypothetical protein